MNLEKKFNNEIDIHLLEKLSSVIRSKNLVRRFEKYYGKIPKEQEIYKIYLKYLDCQILHGKVFNSFGTIKKSAIGYLNSSSPELVLRQFKLIEDYLFYKKIIGEKFFDK